ncbi:Uncharacterised protein [Vibrio cholerae]|uniref:Uncharacterized protein n=1 Tax=Vibrio cholerae TaxID=666 RepID=A0A655USY9_VIBCL|nr:Uncharacterised protein [Vibrio cholerae]CRZ97579.1 Uncharacterised protein [Vibrio cholerae]CSB19422.1 Uncharacterised protein [Vibrio cholerae]CSB31613.1 Uncharacterised protein [Vibrio cholerae]CSB42103.1 Uncharacterised protein [Vibrio cholerae]
MRGLFNAIFFTQQIRFKAIVAYGVFVQEGFIVLTLLDQRVRDAHHHRHICHWVWGNPLGLLTEKLDGFRADRVNADNGFAGFFQLMEEFKACTVGRAPRNFQCVDRV